MNTLESNGNYQKIKGIIESKYCMQVFTFIVKCILKFIVCFLNTKTIYMCIHTHQNMHTRYYNTLVKIPGLSSRCKINTYVCINTLKGMLPLSQFSQFGMPPTIWKDCFIS